MRKKILIFIITYKASYRVVHVMKKIPFDYLKNHYFELLISDDCSNDDTIKYIDQLKVRYKAKLKTNINKVNLGYGGNIKKCLNYAFKNNFDYAVMLHGDNQYNPKYIKEMLKVILKKSNLAAVSGSRMVKKINAIKGKMPIYKFIGNIILSKFFNLLYGTSFTDCHTGYWTYNLKKIDKKFFLKADNNFCFDIDMRIALCKKDKKIKEIPIKTYYGNERSSIHFIYAIRFLWKTIFNKFVSIN